MAGTPPPKTEVLKRRFRCRWFSFFNFRVIFRFQPPVIGHFQGLVGVCRGFHFCLHPLGGIFGTSPPWCSCNTGRAALAATILLTRLPVVPRQGAWPNERRANPRCPSEVRHLVNPGIQGIVVEQLPQTNSNNMRKSNARSCTQGCGVINKNILFWKHHPSFHYQKNHSL